VLSVASRLYERPYPGRARIGVGLLALIMALAVVLVPAPPARAALPSGFDDVVVADVNGPTDLDWTPDGRMLVTAKNGQLWIIENGALLATPALDLAPVMCTNGERALGSVAVHPDFASNNFVYLYYTFNKYGTCNESEIDGPVNRLSRFELVGNTIDPASETVLLDTPPLYRDHHNGGDIIIAGDGYLYVTVGDGGARSLDRPQDPGYLLGKVVRLADDGGIPPGNPFTGPGTARCNADGVPPAGSPDGTVCQEVFALGLRNPFRFALDPNSTSPRFFINDVGQSAYEEISELTTGGADFGWPSREGPCVFDAPTDCDAPPPGFTDPIHWYAHGVDGGAATGGVFVPDGVWPAEYDGVYLYADYVFGNVYRLVPNEGEDRSLDPPRSGYDAMLWADIPQVVAMAFGPHDGGQSLFYVTREGDGVHRIDYVGAANRAPVAVAQADVTSGPLPLTVQFDGTASTDPDGDTLTFAWDFEGDGVVDSTDPAPSHTYESAGTRYAELSVDDGAGATSTDTIRLDPGNNAPVPEILTPAEGATFRVGEVITLQGSATDEEPLGDGNLTWEVRQHHAEHYHPFLEATQGNAIDVVAPEPEDLLAATNSYLEVLLTATDSAGVSTTVSRIVQPEKVDLTFESTPSGLGLTLDGTTVTTPSTIVSWADHSLHVEASDQTDAGGAFWTFEQWSDGGAQTHVIEVTGTATYSATFVEGLSSTLVFNPTDDATIRLDRPDRQIGLDAAIEVDASPEKDTLLRFDIAGLEGREVASATLRMFVTNSSPDGGAIRLATDSAWDEETVTWNTAPAGAGSVIAQIGDVDSGLWAEVDVSAAVAVDGVVTLRITSGSANGADYASLQDPGGNVPELIVAVGSPPGPDLQAPSPPAVLTAVADTPTEIELAWTPATDNIGVVGYDIYRCDGPPSQFGVPCSELLVQVGNVLAYEDQSVAPSSTYTYEVRARDAAGNVSTESNAASATTPEPDTNPPSAPGTLEVTVVGPTEVELAWLAAVDDTELGGYSVYRDGSLLAMVDAATTSYTDTTVEPEMSYTYWVVAFDTSGNPSDPSNSVVVDTPQPPSLVVVPIAEDATVRENRAGRNYGDDPSVEVDGNSVKDALLKFAVPDFGGQTLQRATLRLYVTNSSSSGGTFAVAGNGWSEATVTWATAPAATEIVGSIGDAGRGEWVELDVTAAVLAGGDLSFRAWSTNPNGVEYESREGGANAARLVLVFE
jgi:glucose/arabinose dehydrogenase/PKD repeat protein